MEELEERAEELEEVQNTVNVGLAGVHNKESVEESTDKQNKENLNETEVAPVYVENIKFHSSLHSLNEEIQSTIEKKVNTYGGQKQIMLGVCFRFHWMQK